MAKQVDYEAINLAETLMENASFQEFLKSCAEEVREYNTLNLGRIGELLTLFQNVNETLAPSANDQVYPSNRSAS